MKKKLSQGLSLIDAALICTAIMLTVYALKGIWPFGTENIFYDDMAQGAVPALYHLYDWVHGDKALDWDWYTGLGTNVTNFGNPTPLLLFLCLFKRENVYLAVNLYVVLKVAAAAITSKYVFKKMFPKVDGIWHTVFAVTYSMSTFSMLYYTNTSWLDFVVIVPLVFYGLIRLLNENKPFLYIASLALFLFYSVYHGYMILLSVFFVGALYIALLSPKEKRGWSSCMLGVSTLAGGLISCFAAVPAALQMLSSKRFETGVAQKENLYLKILKTPFDNQIGTKVLLTIGLQLAFVLVFVFLFKLIRDRKKKEFGFVLSCLLIFFIPVICEGTNLIWHVGSYVNFPMRFFFISVFVLLCLALWGIAQYSECTLVHKSRIIRAVMLIGAAVLTVGMLYGLNYFCENIMGTLDGQAKKSAIMLQAAVMLYATGVPAFLFLTCQKKYITQAFCLSLCLVQTFGIAFGLVANKHEKESEEYLYNSPSFLEYCSEVSVFDTHCGELGRIKNYDTSLNTNYPFILGQAALSNWTHSIPLYTQKAAAALGYSTQYTRVLDNGGTAFTDGLFGVKKQIVRSHQKKTAQYEFLDRTPNFVLCKNLYALDFGMLADSRVLEDISGESVNNRFELQNRLWQMFSRSDDTLFDICTRDYDGKNIVLTQSTDDKLVFTYTPVTDNEMLYLNAGAYKKQSYKMTVNGEKVLAAYHKYTDYRYYPSAAVNGILTLGSFSKGETVEIVVECINGQTFGSKPVQLASMPLEKLNRLNSLYSQTVTNEKLGKTSLSFDYNNVTGENRFVFIPVSYDSGFTCKINGENATVHKALGAYIAVELPAGSGQVEMNWRPEGETIGIALTVLGLSLCLFIFVFIKKGWQFPSFISKTVFWGLTAALIVAAAAIYVIPGFSAIYYEITDLLPKQ